MTCLRKSKKWRKNFKLESSPSKFEFSKILQKFLNYPPQSHVQICATVSWNKLPSDVKMASSLNMFKSNLELYKNKTRALGISGSGNYWEISDDVLNRIEGGSYLENKMRHNEFLKDNPFAAKRKFINLH